MSHVFSCNCGELLMKSQNNRVKIRGKVFLVKEDGFVYTVCKSCNSEVKVPLDYKKSPKLFIRNGKESS